MTKNKNKNQSSGEELALSIPANQERWDCQEECGSAHMETARNSHFRWFYLELAWYSVSHSCYSVSL